MEQGKGILFDCIILNEENATTFLLLRF